MRYLSVIMLAIAGCGDNRTRSQILAANREMECELAELTNRLEEIEHLPWWLSIPPEDVISIASSACAVAGAILFVGSFAALWFIGRKAFMACLLGGLTLIAASPILAFIGANLVWLGALVAIGIGYLVWNRIEYIEGLLGLDLNRDGQIGELDE